MHKLIMMIEEVRTYEDILKILACKEVLSFKFFSTKKAYSWIESIFIQFNYAVATKKEKGLIIKYVQYMTNYSPRQIKRLAKNFKQHKHIALTSKRSNTSYATKFTPIDIKLLAETDALHNNLNGFAIKNILEKEFLVYKNAAYSRLAKISVAHIYNLRKTTKYREINLNYTKTTANKKATKIGERRKPYPEGKPGYIRIDTVHQGDLNKEKGVYYIHAVDEVTQWDIVVAVEKISEAYLIPALIELLDQFPFEIIEFHSDNGSEYINYTVADLLNKLMIKLTKSRSGRTNDNALVESKNCSIIRKNMGYGFIEQKHAPRINLFYGEYFNTYLNYFRPCLFPETIVAANGKRTKKYHQKNTMTPYEKLKTISNYTYYLKPNFSIEKNDSFVNTTSPNQFAERMVKAKHSLFDEITIC